MKHELTPTALAVALSVMVLIGVLSIAGALGGAFLLIHQNNVNEKKQAQLVEHRLCTTLDGLASLRPPAGNPKTNPSRAYLQFEHDKLALLAPDVGCEAR